MSGCGCVYVFGGVWGCVCGGVVGVGNGAGLVCMFGVHWVFVCEE